MVLVVAVAIVAAVVLLTGGGGDANGEKQVRATLTAYAQAFAQKDYKTICRRFLSQSLLDQLRQIRLPCRTALAQELGSTQAPTLTVKSVKVTGTTALADVQGGAANQPAGDRTIELVKDGGLWRIRSLSKPKTSP